VTEATETATAMFPLSTVLFPRAVIALHVFEQRYRSMVADCLAADCGFGVVLISRGSEVGGGDERVSVGTTAEIEIAQPLSDGRWALVARGLRRFRVVSWTAEEPYPQAVLENFAEARSAPSSAAMTGAEAAVSRARALLSELGETLAPRSDPDDALTEEDRVWGLCASAPLPESDRQRLLEVDDHAGRLELLTRLCGELADDVAGYLRRSP
jgi:uncharacterized protein